MNEPVSSWEYERAVAWATPLDVPAGHELHGAVVKVDGALAALALRLPERATGVAAPDVEGRIASIEVGPCKGGELA